EAGRKGVGRMSGVSGVGGGSQIADLMKILEQGQQQTLDLAKKLITVANSTKVSSAEAEGKGAALDVYA
ncbi:MAG TPA: hypothetical protein PKM25_16705, partial [Candidatus Ozemobacteraceae bacterium]|nr:hypothetical protein [Candidatus Ozemobacteraceae bacterium]